MKIPTRDFLNWGIGVLVACVICGTYQASFTRNHLPALSVISIQELTFQGMELMAAPYLTFEVRICVTLLNFLQTYSYSCLAGKLGLRLRRPYQYRGTQPGLLLVKE